MAPVLVQDALHPYLSLHIIRERFLAVCTNYILWLITIFFNCMGLDTCWSIVPFHVLRSLFVSCFLFCKLEQFSFLPKVFLFDWCRPVTLNPHFAIFPASTSRYVVQTDQIFRNPLLRAYCANVNTLFHLFSIASVVTWMFFLKTGVYVLSEWALIS
jgi:hypothetical protein